VKLYFGEIISKNMYAKKVKNKNIVNLNLGGFMKHLYLKSLVPKYHKILHLWSTYIYECKKSKI
jgi:hypothetical protein